MAGPRFSVVIPTRERAETLCQTLRSCLAQDFSDYEVIVCDNAGSPRTRRVVEELGSPKVRYLRAPRPLAMSDNWELAVSQARGEYLVLLGDDDALLFHALRALDRLLSRYPARAVRWTAAYYGWPDIALANQANYLRIPLGRTIQIVQAREAIARVIGFENCYSTLPMLYNAAVQRSLVLELRDRAGRVFGCGIPDVYSGFALGFLAGTYLSTDTPMHICGQSGRSYGVATLLLRGPSDLADEFHSLNRDARLTRHPWVPDLALFPEVPVAEAFLAAKRNLFPDDPDLRLDRRLLASRCLQGAEAQDVPDGRAPSEVIRDSLGDDPELLAWFDQNLREHRALGVTRHLSFRGAPGFDGDCLHLNAQEFGVRDVFGAAGFCEKILGYQGAELWAQSPPEPDRPSPLEHYQRMAEERLTTIQRLHALAEERRALVEVLDNRVRQLSAELTEHRRTTWWRRIGRRLTASMHKNAG